MAPAPLPSKAREGADSSTAGTVLRVRTTVAASTCMQNPNPMAENWEQLSCCQRAAPHKGRSYRDKMSMRRAMVCLHLQGLEQILLISHEEATQVQHCSASFGTDHSYLTGRLQRRAWGGITSRLEIQTEHSHSFVNGLQLCFQQAGLQHLWRQLRTGGQMDKSSYLTPSKQL